MPVAYKRSSKVIQPLSSSHPSGRHNHTYIFRLKRNSLLDEQLINRPCASLSSPITQLIRRIANYDIEFHIPITSKESVLQMFQ